MLAWDGVDIQTFIGIIVVAFACGVFVYFSAQAQDRVARCVIGIYDNSEDPNTALAAKDWCQAKEELGQL